MVGYLNNCLYGEQEMELGQDGVSNVSLIVKQ